MSIDPYLYGLGYLAFGVAAIIRALRGRKD